MIVKVVLKTMQNARKLVSIVEPIPCDVELCCGRYAVNAKSMLGVLSMPDFEKGELHVHTDNDKECEQILHKLLEADLLMDTNDAACRSIYDITVFGEILIDFTSQRLNEDGQMLYARNPGGAPANVAVQQTGSPYCIYWKSRRGYAWGISQVCTSEGKCGYQRNAAGQKIFYNTCVCGSK